MPQGTTGETWILPYVLLALGPAPQQERQHHGHGRRHGHALQPRWTEGEWPPVQSLPPWEGMPGLERNHAYHCRLAPAVLLSARCNRDLSILLRLPRSVIACVTSSPGMCVCSRPVVYLSPAILRYFCLRCSIFYVPARSWESWCSERLRHRSLLGALVLRALCVTTRS